MRLRNLNSEAQQQNWYNILKKVPHLFKTPMESTSEALPRIATLLNRNLADSTPITTTEQPKAATSEGVQPKTFNNTNQTTAQTSEGAIKNKTKIA